MLITNIGRLVTMEPGKGRKGELGVIENACIEVEEGRITACYPSPAVQDDKLVVDAKGGVVIPGLIDCHTHLVHAGDRADEFAMRSRGASYEAIAKAGGGIMSTVRATRAASEDELLASAVGRAKEAISYGITMMEVKSGYGLDIGTELKMLRVIRRLYDVLPIDLVPTYLGAHTFPGKDRKAYIKLIIDEVLPQVAAEELAAFCDIFVDKIAFTAKEAEAIFLASEKCGLRPKLHADQLSSCGGAKLAAKLKAISADHLENISKGDMKLLAKAGVTAVLIPSSTFFIGGKYAPAREMIKAGVDVAISTDYNPGTSPILNLWLAAAIAITQMKLTPEEAYKGITLNAARALDMENTHGSIAVGKAADLVILDTKNEFEPFYRFDHPFVSRVIKKGEVIYETAAHQCCA